MITEDYVNFETAKLLKEKGFDGNTNCYYIEGSAAKDIYYSPIRENHNKRITNNEFDIDIDIISSRISAPTIQMAMKCLREVHKECIVVQPIVTDDDGSAGCLWRFSISRLLELQYESESIYELYETACEAAIKYCLENLI